MHIQLQGIRIWLSASIPDDIHAEDKNAIIEFVKKFVSSVFRGGGYIIHGSHPSITPIIISEAEKYISESDRKDCLILAISRHWSKDSNEDLQTLRKKCIVYETPEADTGNIRDDSLMILRRWMCERADAFVAVGGKLWSTTPGRAGVPLEAKEAIERGLPCFLLGGLGGAIADFVKDNHHFMRKLKNGLTEDANEIIAAQKNVDELSEIICQQLSRLPLIRGRASDGVSFRILALDGGGIKGVFTASVLATLEESLGEPIAQHFDLIAGTSTGGILAIGLGMGLSPKSLLEFYRKHGAEIFPISEFYCSLWRNIVHYFAPKYSNAALTKLLKSVYCTDGNENSLDDSLCRLVVPAYDVTSGLCHVFRTPHHKLLAGDAKTKAWEVAAATASAPTYFSASSVKNMITDSTFFDGGIWANCPALAGIVEAVCYLKIPLERIDVLSIGVTSEPFTVKMFSNAGIIKWNKSLIKLFMNAQVDSAITHSRELIGEAKFLRINETTPSGHYTLDDPQNIKDLATLGNKIASSASLLSQVRSRFLNGVHALSWKQHII